jgi:hypothetical protein
MGLSNVDDILQITITRDTPCPISYECKVIVGFDQERFLKRLLELGEDYLEENRTFAVLFDTTPLETVYTDMLDYKEVLNHFPDSNRVLGKAMYIGNFNKEDHAELVDNILKQLLINYKIMETIY